MNDITNFRLSKEANEVATKLESTEKFDHITSIAKLAFAYAIRNYYGKINPGKIVVSDSDGSNYNVGSFNDLEPYVRVLYNTETPYIYIKALINFGLIEIGKIIDSEGIPKIYSLCE
ncbi:MAG: hypothetical protein SPL46_09495 [Selenomonadaceae bacterium]|nr:hypothetical protein [Selenomonadaceae bacterium]